MTTSIISDVGVQKSDTMDTDAMERNGTEVDGESLHDAGSLIITRKLSEHNDDYTELSNNAAYVIENTEDLTEADHDIKGTMLSSAAHGEAELSSTNNVMLLSSANSISSADELGRFVFGSDISPPPSRVGTMVSEPPTPSSPQEVRNLLVKYSRI